MLKDTKDSQRSLKSSHNLEEEIARLQAENRMIKEKTHEKVSLVKIK